MLRGRRKSARTTGLILALPLTLTACVTHGDDTVGGRDIEAVADEARSLVDELAEKVGTSPRVTQDVITDCVPGRSDSGQDLVYSVRVEVGPGATERLQGAIRAEYEDEGWAASVLRDGDLRLRKDDVTIGATVFADQGVATVSGTGGCVE